MASSSSTFTFTSLQRRELFCKFFSSSINPLNNSLSSSSHTFPFPSSRNTLPPKSSIFLYPVKKNNQSFSFSCLDNHNSSSETIDFRNVKKTLGSGCSLSGFNEERVVRSFVRGKAGNLAVDEEIVKNLVNYGEKSENGSGFSLSGFNEERVVKNFAKGKGGNLAVDEEIEKTLVSYGEKSKKGFRVSSSRWSAKREEKNMEILPLNNVVVNGNVQRQSTKDNNSKNDNNSQSVSRFRGAWRRSECNSFTLTDDDSKCKSKNEIKINKKGNVTKKDKVGSPEFQLRVGLDMCSKKGDVMGAISLYDVAVKKGVRIGQYHYTVLLYLCSSAAMGFIQPAKSGSTSRKRNSAPSRTLDEPNEEDEDDSDDDGDGDGDDMKDCPQKPEVVENRVSDDVKKYALEKGFKIYESMCSDKVQMNEATLTAIARMAMAMGEGDMAFEMVKKMKEIGISPKLRSYDPALSTFSSKGDVDKAFDVEKHMLENGVQPEEPELEALLRVSVESGKAEKVYYLLHKLRTNVRSISPSTAYLIEKWFKSKEASKVGKRKYVPKMIAQTMENLGGGWHGKGWLGIGKWNVTQTFIRSDGLCKCCGEKLALIDLDPKETEMFAQSVASIALKREKNLSFQKFQRWLEYYGPFEAVVDAANIGLYTQRKFKPSKVNLIVNGIRHMFPSRKWPLIILHNRRLTGSTMEQPVNMALVDRWRNADALYATPTGSNDDWYWLYAAIKFKCLLVTNDEMRDHTFQLLATDFFPKWKERHQVRFSFSEAGPVFHMPPPYSVVIQESEKGHWHIPIATESQSEEDRIWLCITRMNSHNHTASANSGEDSKEDLKDDKECGTSNFHPQLQVQAHNKPKFEEFSLKAHRHLREKPGESELSKSNHRPIWNSLKAAENLGGCVIDFQI